MSQKPQSCEIQEKSIFIHPILITEFEDKCKQLQIKNPQHLVAALMRDFMIECSLTDNKPAILEDSILVQNIQRR